MCLSSSYYFISIYLFEQFNVVSKPQLNILNYLQGCGVQMPNTAVLEKSLPALARTCMPEQREQCSSAQISLVHPSPAGGQGESLLTAWGFILSMGSHSNTPAMEGRAEQSRAELQSLKGRTGVWADPGAAAQSPPSQASGKKCTETSG